MLVWLINFIRNLKKWKFLNGNRFSIIVLKKEIGKIKEMRHFRSLILKFIWKEQNKNKIKRKFCNGIEWAKVYFEIEIHLELKNINLYVEIDF